MAKEWRNIPLLCWNARICFFFQGNISLQQFLHKRDFGIVIMHNLCNKKSYLSGAIYCKITFYAFLCTSFFSSCAHSWWLLYGYFYKWHSQTHISLPHPALPIFLSQNIVMTYLWKEVFIALFSSQFVRFRTMEYVRSF